MLDGAGEAAVIARMMQSGAPPLVIDLHSMSGSGLPKPLEVACKRLAAAPDARLVLSNDIAAAGAWLVERLGPARIRFHIHGTGEVAAVLARVLAGTPFTPLLHDPASGLHEAIAADAGAFHAVLTGSHEADLEICRRLLATNRFGYLGLIGSRAKRAGVVARLSAAGIAPQAVQRLSCPIGLAQVRGKEPAVIAIAIAAEAIARLRPAPTR